VLELTSDIALGTNEVEGFDNYKAFIAAHKLAPLTHPTLIQTGVSMLKLQDMSDLTIYSKNGAKITHTCIDITGSSNITNSDSAMSHFSNKQRKQRSLLLLSIEVHKYFCGAIIVQYLVSACLADQKKPSAS
jgi:hypothetical protein